MDEDEKQKLRSWAADMGIALSPSRIDLFGLYLSELFEWNKRINLAGLSSRKRIIKELLLDSIIPLSFLPEEGRFLDIGSGAGFPAIPIKICRPRIKAHLLEPNSKKVSFLKQIVRLTKLCEIEIIRGRIERDGNLLHPDGYHIISSRALGAFAPDPGMVRFLSYAGWDDCEFSGEPV